MARVRLGIGPVREQLPDQVNGNDGRRVDQQLASLLALLDVSTRLTESLDLDPVLAAVLDATRRLFSADRAAIYHCDESGCHSCLASFGLSQAYVETVARHLTATPAFQLAAETHQPALIPDLPAKALGTPTGEAATAEGVHVVLGLPLLRRGELVGYLAIYHDRPRAYSPEEMQVAQALATQAAVAIDNARLYQAAQSRAQEVQALYEATKRISNSLDLSTTLNCALDDVVRLSQSEFAGVALLGPDGTTLRYEAVRGPQAYLREGASLLIGEGFGGLAARTGEVVNAPDIERDPRWLRLPDTVAAGVRSMLYVPLRNPASVIGVLAAWSRQPGHFTPARERLLVSLAEQVALAIEHARLFAQAGKLEALQELDRLKSEFVSVVSHELRTPLTAIIGYTDILLRQFYGALNDRQAEHQQAVRLNALRLLSLVNDLLDVSKIEAGRVQVRQRTIDLDAEIERAVDAIAALATEKGLTVDLVREHELPPVWADPDRLAQVLANLLSNAIKFTPPGGRVVVRARPEGSGARVLVADTGIGLDPERLERVWERFFQVESSATRRFGGTGLGLTIVRGLVELMGGRVQAESAGLGHGATFSFTLPGVSPADRD